MRAIIDDLRHRRMEEGDTLLGVPREYFYDVCDRDGEAMIRVARELTCRILVLQGGRDYQCTREDFEKLIIPHEDITLGAAIGSGSFGQVYQARWIVEEVAVKRLMPNLNMVTELEDEFLHEVTVMSQLKSKYIVPLRGITVSPYGMVMEYMPQGTLSHLLHESEIPVPASLQYRLANDIVKGMAFLHHHCILHRDLKSDNILLTQNYEARLADFGLAKIKNVSSQSSKTGSMVGTVPYTAPEILDDEGDQKYLPASDVYSYGVVVWEITARQRPWANKGALFIIANVAVKGKRELIPPHAPKILQDVTAQAWAQAPAQRPSMMAILQQLEAAPVEAEDVAAQHPRAKGPAQGDLTPNWATGGRGPGVNPAQLGHFAGGRAQADRGGLRGNQDSHAPRGKYGGKRGHGGLRGNFDSQAPRPRGVDGGW